MRTVQPVSTVKTCCCFCWNNSTKWMKFAVILASEEIIWYQSLISVGAQNVPKCRCYFKLARQKVNDQNKGQKNGGSPT